MPDVRESLATLACQQSQLEITGASRDSCLFHPLSYRICGAGLRFLIKANANALADISAHEQPVRKGGESPSGFEPINKGL